MSPRWRFSFRQVGRAIGVAWRSTIGAIRASFRALHQLLVWLRILPRNPHLPFHRYVIKHLPVMVVVFLLTLAAEKMGWFRGLETYGLDVLLRLNDRPTDAPIFLVLIDDEDYTNIFHGTSPLAPDPLRNLLADIARAKPKLIGVDIDTAHPSYAAINDWPDAIWARDVRSAAVNDPEADEQQHADHQEEGEPHGSQAHSAHESIPVLRGLALGRTVQEFEEGAEAGEGAEGAEAAASTRRIRTQPRSALPLFPVDADGVIRRYQRVFFSPGHIGGGDDEAYLPSLSWAITRDYCGADSDANTDPAISPRLHQDLKLSDSQLTEPIGLNFALDRYRIPRIQARNVQRAAQQDYWDKNSPLRDAIVLVGGTYSAARDSYATPVGNRHGVELLAHAIETDLTGGGIREFNHRLAQILDLGVGLSFLFVTWRFPGRAAFHISLASMAVLSLGASWFAFRTVAYWFNFIPMLAGQLLELEWERGKELAELRHEASSRHPGRTSGH